MRSGMASPKRFVIEVYLQVHASCRWVADRDRTFDASWLTSDGSRAKCWKTQRGAERWIADRPDITERFAQLKVVEVSS